jgi:hypothetical protein
VTQETETIASPGFAGARSTPEGSAETIDTDVAADDAQLDRSATPPTEPPERPTSAGD